MSLEDEDTLDARSEFFGLLPESVSLRAGAGRDRHRRRLRRAPHAPRPEPARDARRRGHRPGDRRLDVPHQAVGVGGVVVPHRHGRRAPGRAPRHRGAVRRVLDHVDHQHRDHDDRRRHRHDRRPHHRCRVHHVAGRERSPTTPRWTSLSPA